MNILVLTFSEAGHTRVIIRPSGTEPTIKYYVSASTVDMDGDRESIDNLAKSVLAATIELCELLQE